MVGTWHKVLRLLLSDYLSLSLSLSLASRILLVLFGVQAIPCILTILPLYFPLSFSLSSLLLHVNIATWYYRHLTLVNMYNKKLDILF